MTTKTKTAPAEPEQTARAARPLPAVQAGQISKANALKLLGCEPVALKRARRLGFIPDPDHYGRFAAGPLIAGWSRYLQSGKLMIEEAGDLIGRSAPWVARLIREGFIAKQPDGSVLREDVLQGYAKWLQDDARRISRSAEEAQWRGAKARKVEMETAVMDERTVETAEAEEVLTGVVDIFRAEMASLPASVAADPAMREAVAAAAAEIIQRAEQRLGDRLAAVRRRAVVAPAARA